MLSGERSGLAQRVFWVDRHVFDLYSVPLQSNSTDNGPSTGGDRMVLHECPKFRRKPESCCCSIVFPLATVDKRHLSFAQPRGRFDKSVQYCLQIKRRAANDLEHVSSRRLLLQRFAQISRALLQLIEQPRILDRDDGLGGEVAEQLDLFIAEGPDLLTVDVDCTKHIGFFQHWYG